MIVSCRQRVYCLTFVELCSVTVTPAAGRLSAKPSRVKVTALTLLLAEKVSPLVSAREARRIWSVPSIVPIVPVSVKTSQPPAHEELAEQVAPSVLEQTDTVCPSLIASARANCMSPRRPLTSLEMRLAVVTYL